MPQGVSIANLSKRFVIKRQEVVAVDRISLDLPAAGIGAIIGPSGCGKSTLLRIIADLIEPSTGEVRLGQYAPRDLRVKKRIGFVFQTPSLLGWKTVQSNIEISRKLGTAEPPAEPGMSTEKLLALVGLTDFASAYPHQLSGGMQQRVSIARALYSSPEVLLLDEPFGALDELTRLHMNTEMSRILRAAATTAILVTHNIAEAVFMADRVWVMSPRPGTIVRTIDVPLPSRRTLAMMDTPLFGELVSELRQTLFGFEPRSNPEPAMA
jgi:NitT/TauT family transport system ATP-binding protein